MKIIILSLFPDMFTPLEQSIIKRAQERNLVSIRIVNFRDWAKGKHKQVDDTPCGGGAGMVLMAQPIVDCIESLDPDHSFHRIYLTPAASTLTQNKVMELAKLSNLLFVCGHYEGIDQRAIDLCIDEKISIGEYVLTGGEIPAMVVVDAVVRQIPDVIKQESIQNESYTSGKNWEHPQYTKPRDFRGLLVPEVLLSGNHAQIEKWKRENSYHLP